MPRIGFSTGALALSDYRKGLDILIRHDVKIVEISALRDTELAPLIASLDALPLTSFTDISFHAPSKLTVLDESGVAELLQPIKRRGWPIILHPDVVKTPEIWKAFGSLLCLENMDNRKPIGRTLAELEPVFTQLPEASFCFDIGHARQVDPTMGEAARMLKRFGDRLRQLHVSEVNPASKHEAMSPAAIRDFQSVASLIPPKPPFILESMIAESDIAAEMSAAASILR